MLAHKAVRAGYCDKCQRFAKVDRSALTELSSISSPWPFAQWGIDIVGLMPLGKGNCKFLVVDVDYFITK
jgi:hypothetical protein